MIVEFAPHGNLKEYLLHKRPFSSSPYQDGAELVNQLMPQDLVSFSFQAARGMEYLTCRKVS